jgi:crossover junction endodeoxyribonuclease RusA
MNSRAKGKRITITVPVPPRELSPNARAHWRAMSVKKRCYKDVCYIVAKSADNLPESPFAKATIRYEGHFKARAWDDDNLIGAMKYARDSFARAGIVADDKHFKTIGAECIGYSKNPRVIVTIEGA